MSHLEFHQHAFIDNSNTVINIAVFDELAHNSQLLENIKIANNATEVICCCTYGLPGMGWIWTGSEFRPPQPYPSWLWDNSIKEWVAPIPNPEVGFSEWDESTKSWITV